MRPQRKQSPRAKHRVKSLLTSTTQFFTQRIIEARVPDTLDFITGRFAALLKMPLEDAIAEAIKMLVFLHTISPKWQKTFVRQIWRSRILGKKVGSVRDLNHTVIELILKNLKSRNDRIRPKNVEVAVFILVHAIEAAIHAAVVDRPEILKDPGFATELTDLVVRYLMTDRT